MNTISSEEIFLVSLHYRGFDTRYFAVISSLNVNTQTTDVQDNALLNASLMTATIFYLESKVQRTISVFPV